MAFQERPVFIIVSALFRIRINLKPCQFKSNMRRICYNLHLNLVKLGYSSQKVNFIKR